MQHQRCSADHNWSMLIRIGLCQDNKWRAYVEQQWESRWTSRSDEGRHRRRLDSADHDKVPCGQWTSRTQTRSRPHPSAHSDFTRSA